MKVVRNLTAIAAVAVALTIAAQARANTIDFYLNQPECPGGVCNSSNVPALISNSSAVEIVVTTGTISGVIGSGGTFTASSGASGTGAEVEFIAPSGFVRRPVQGIAITLQSLFGVAKQLLATRAKVIVFRGTRTRLLQQAKGGGKESLPDRGAVRPFRPQMCRLKKQPRVSREDLFDEVVRREVLAAFGQHQFQVVRRTLQAAPPARPGLLGAAILESPGAADEPNALVVGHQTDGPAQGAALGGGADA